MDVEQANDLGGYGKEMPQQGRPRQVALGRLLADPNCLVVQDASTQWQLGDQETKQERGERRRETGERRRGPRDGRDVARSSGEGEGDVGEMAPRRRHP